MVLHEISWGVMAATVVSKSILFSIKVNQRRKTLSPDCVCAAAASYLALFALFCNQLKSLNCYSNIPCCAGSAFQGRSCIALVVKLVRIVR